MKFVIQNYASNYHTEPYYFNMAINLLPNSKSCIWNTSEISAYDIFDIVKPDVYITHALLINQDAIKYMQSNKNIGLVVNANGVSEADLYNIEDILLNHNVNCEFFFHDSMYNVKTKKIKTVQINAGADVFLDIEKQKFLIDNAIIIDSANEIKEYDVSHHNITSNSKIKDSADLFLPSARVASLFRNYNNIVFRSLPWSSQLLYDAIYYANNVIIDFDDNSKIDYFNKSIKMNIIDTDFKTLKETIKQKHTCLNRTKSLLSQFSSKEQLEHLEALIQASENIKK